MDGAWRKGNQVIALFTMTAADPTAFSAAEADTGDTGSPDVPPRYGLLGIEPILRNDPADTGSYRVLARLGSGGLGTVYAARRRDRAEELAAVKVLRPHTAAERDFRPRFEREAAAISRVRSDFVPALIDARSGDAPPWLAYELIPGPSLSSVVSMAGPLPETAVWHLGSGIAEALTAIHAAQVVHRDLKPTTVLLTAGQPWIIGFGLAHLTDTPHLPSDRVPIGTLQYSPPEQLMESLQAAGPPGDIYALGATLLFAVTGHPPRAAERSEQLFIEALGAAPNLAGVPGGLRGLIESCLLPAPDDRPSLEELRQEFTLHAGTTGHDGFTEALPQNVVALLKDYREELADVIGAHGPVRMGW
jgi:serine/threonine protein kinase